MASPEAEALRICTAALNGTLANTVNLIWFADRLFAEGLIRQETQGSVCTVDASNYDKACTLTQAVAAHISEDPRSFSRFITILQEKPALTAVMNNLLDEYAKLNPAASTFLLSQAAIAMARTHHSHKKEHVVSTMPLAPAVRARSEPQGHARNRHSEQEITSGHAQQHSQWRPKEENRYAEQEVKRNEHTSHPSDSEAMLRKMLAQTLEASRTNETRITELEEQKRSVEEQLKTEKEKWRQERKQLGESLADFKQQTQHLIAENGFLKRITDKLEAQVDELKQLIAQRDDFIMHQIQPGQVQQHEPYLPAPGVSHLQSSIPRSPSLPAHDMYSRKQYRQQETPVRVQFRVPKSKSHDTLSAHAQPPLGITRSPSDSKPQEQAPAAWRSRAATDSMRPQPSLGISRSRSPQEQAPWRSRAATDSMRPQPSLGISRSRSPQEQAPWRSRAATDSMRPQPSLGISRSRSDSKPQEQRSRAATDATRHSGSFERYSNNQLTGQQLGEATLV